MSLRKLVFALSLCMSLSAYGLGTNRAAGTPLTPPEKPVENVGQCLACHNTVKPLHDRGAHKDLNCGSCHQVPADHAKAPSAKNRPSTRFDHAACAQCHKQEFDDMIDTKYHEKWAEAQRNPSYAFIRGTNGQPQQLQSRLPRFHIGIMADIAVNRTGGRFVYKDPMTEGKPVVKLWDVIKDTMPEDGDLFKHTPNPALAWRPHKSIGYASQAYCLKCKSADNMLESAYTGKPHPKATVQRDSLALPTMRSMNSSFNCIYCHDPHSAEPRIINEMLIETMVNPVAKDNAYQTQAGKPGMTRIKTHEMGVRGFTRKIGILEKYDSNFQCGQCHMAGNLSGTFKDRDTGKGIPGVKAFEDDVRYLDPFVKGGALALWKYYRDRNWYTSVDPTTGVKWAAPRAHPHVEAVTQSKHGKAGVGCTDCHQAKVNGRSEHNPSEMKQKIENTCMRSECHGPGSKTNWTRPGQARYVLEAIQQRGRIHAEKMETQGKLAAEFLASVKKGETRVKAEELEALKVSYERYLTVQGYWFTDYSNGFHDPKQYEEDVVGVTKELRKSLADAKKAVIK